MLFCKDSTGMLLNLGSCEKIELVRAEYDLMSGNSDAHKVVVHYSDGKTQVIKTFLPNCIKDAERFMKYIEECILKGISLCYTTDMWYEHSYEIMHDRY